MITNNCLANRLHLQLNSNEKTKSLVFGNQSVNGLVTEDISTIQETGYLINPDDEDGGKNYNYTARYLNDIGVIETLNNMPGREIQLGKAINAGREADEIIYGIQASQIIKKIESDTRDVSNLKKLKKVLSSSNAESKSKIKAKRAILGDEAKAFFRRYIPEYSSEIFKLTEQGLTNDKILKRINEVKTYSDIVKASDEHNENIVQAAKRTMKNTKTTYTPNEIISKLITFIKEGNVAKREIEDAEETFKNQNYSKKDYELLNQGVIPKDLNNKRNESKKAQNELVKRTQKILITIAKEFSNKFPFLDAVGIGQTALQNAAEKFDYTQGFVFNTFAGRSIKNELISAPVDHIKHSKKYSKHMHIIENINKRTQIEFGRPATMEELEKGTGLKEDDLIKIMKEKYKTVSLQNPIKNDSSEEHGDFIVNTKSLTPQKILEQKEMYEKLPTILEKMGLTPIEAHVFILRFALTENNASKLKLSEIGNHFFFDSKKPNMKPGEMKEGNKEVGVEAVRQVEHRAINKVKKHLMQLSLIEQTPSEEIEKIQSTMQKKLCKYERKIIELRYGLNHPYGIETKSLYEIAKKLGVSQKYDKNYYAFVEQFDEAMDKLKEKKGKNDISIGEDEIRKCKDLSRIKEFRTILGTNIVRKFCIDELNPTEK